MNPEQHMHRAFKRLEVARLNLRSGYPDDSCNRSYYAIFEAASAVLAVLGISPPKTHKGVAKLFQQHVVKPGRVDTNMGAVISRIERLRLIADYEGVPIEMEQAHDALQQAEKFVEMVREELLVLDHFDFPVLATPRHPVLVYFIRCWSIVAAPPVGLQEAE